MFIIINNLDKKFTNLLKVFPPGIYFGKELKFREATKIKARVNPGNNTLFSSQTSIRDIYWFRKFKIFLHFSVSLLVIGVERSQLQNPNKSNFQSFAMEQTNIQLPSDFNVSSRKALLLNFQFWCDNNSGLHRVPCRLLNCHVYTPKLTLKAFSRLQLS